MLGLKNKATMVTSDAALPGREERMPVPAQNFVNGNLLSGPFPDEMKIAMFGLGCFWGAEKLFWTLSGVFSTAVGYAAGFTPNPTYQEVCSGQTGHNEVVRIVFDPGKISYQDLLRCFWEGHNPTQGMQQGNDRGTQYRSGLYVYDEDQRQVAENSCEQYQSLLTSAGFDNITTEIKNSPEFYFAEDYHQQYLAKNPTGYCGLGGTGIVFSQRD